MRRDSDYLTRMAESLREQAAQVGPVVQTNVEWGGFRAERGEPPAPTAAEWIARFRRGMFQDAGIPGRGWTHRVLAG